MRHSALGENVQKRTVDVIMCVKSSSHHSSRGKYAKECEILRECRALFGELLKHHSHVRHCHTYVSERRCQKGTRFVIFKFPESGQSSHASMQF